jgi:spore maturation protein CgeB
MPPPRYETWFMEGTLVPGYHYVQVKDDFSDLDSQIDYYLAHPDQAKAIIENANRYVAGFYNARQERLTALLVFDRYLAQTHPQHTT